MNNKGQTLVVFVLLLPLIVVIIYALFKFSSLYIEKNKLQNTVKQIITDELKKEDDSSAKRNHINSLIYQNIDNISSYDLNVDDKYIMITVTKKINNTEIKVSYQGYKINDKIKIESK